MHQPACDPEPIAAPHGREEIRGRYVKFDDFDDGDLAAGHRAINIYLPDGYEQSDDRYPVVYFNDGGNVFSGTEARMDVDLASDQLVADGLILPALFVGVGNASLPGRVKT